MSGFIPIPKKGNAKECSNYRIYLTCQQTNAQNSPSRFLQFMNHELSDVQAGLRKDRGTRDQIDNIYRIIEKAREFQKNIYLCFIDYVKALTVWITTNCGKFLEMGIRDHLTCLLRNLYVAQEATVRMGHGVKDWFLFEKGGCQGCTLSLYLNYVQNTL